MTQTPRPEPAAEPQAQALQPPPKLTKTTLEGAVPPLTDEEQRRKAIDMAFDYRGDVTIDTRDGRSLTGYVFNRDAQAAEPYARMMLTEGGQTVIKYADVAKLTFSGKDTAAGRSWESWLKRYVEKKMAGEAANIESEYQ